MSYLFLIFAIISYSIYIFIKFEELRRHSDKLPSFAEIRDYRMINENDHRNAKAFRTLSIFILLMAMIAIPTSDPLSDLLKDDGFVSILYKFLILAVLGANFFARYIAYKDNTKDNVTYAMPLQEIIAVFQQTGLFSKGYGFLSTVINLTTSLGIIFIGIIIIGLVV